MLSHRSQHSYSGQLLLRKQQQETQGSPAAGGLGPLLTDRSSYIAYLESQLERVSAACLTVQSFDERLEAATSAARLLEEKVLNVARLVNCTQQYAEQKEAAQREGLAGLAARLAALEARVGELGGWEAALAAKLEGLGEGVDSKVQGFMASFEERLQKVAESLGEGLEAKCHASHLQLDERVSDAAGRLGELDRRVRALDERAQQAAGMQPQVASLAARVGSMEDSLSHLAAASAGVKQVLVGVEQAVGQLRTAVVALELRPPVEGTQDTPQWLARAREALKGEIQSVLAQSRHMAENIQAAQLAAQEQPPSPHKAVAEQVLSSMQGTLRGEVGRELQALQLADSFIASVASQLAQSPKPAGQQHQNVAASPQPLLAKPGPVPGTDLLAAVPPPQQPGQSFTGAGAGWSIPAVPAARAAQLACDAPLAPAQQTAVDCCYAGAISSVQPLQEAQQQQQQHSPSHTVLQVSIPTSQQLPPRHSQPCSPSWAAASGHGWQPVSLASPALHATGVQEQGVSAASACCPPVEVEPGGGALRGSLGQMQAMLQSVCTLLQQEGGTAGSGALESGRGDPLGATSSACHLGRAAGMQQAPGIGRLPANVRAAGMLQSNNVQTKRGWCPGGGGAGGASKTAPATARSSSLRSTVGTAQAQRAIEERRRRLQQLYAELRQG